jgi:hypothetical protein
VRKRRRSFEMNFGIRGTAMRQHSILGVVRNILGGGKIRNLKNEFELLFSFIRKYTIM